MSSFTNGQLAILDSLAAQGYADDVIEAQKRLYEALNSTLTVEEEEDIVELMEQHEEDMRPMLEVTETATPASGGGTKRKRGAPKGPRALPAPDCRCMARVYGTGHEQCKSRRHKDHGEYCATHGKMAAETEQPLQFKDATADEASKMTTAQLQLGLFHGRIDQPLPTHNAEGERCVFWKGEDTAMIPNWDNPATFLGEETGGWHAFSAEGKKAISLNKRWRAKLEKEGAKELEAAERSAKKADKTASKEAKKLLLAASKKKLPKKVNSYFYWLNNSGVRGSITSAIAQQPGRNTVVKSAEITKLAGLMWKAMEPTMKSTWTEKAKAAETKPATPAAVEA